MYECDILWRAIMWVILLVNGKLNLATEVVLYAAFCCLTLIYVVDLNYQFAFAGFIFRTTGKTDAIYRFAIQTTKGYIRLTENSFTTKVSFLHSAHYNHIWSASEHRNWHLEWHLTYYLHYLSNNPTILETCIFAHCHRDHVSFAINLALGGLWDIISPSF